MNTGREILNREALEKKFEITNNLEILDEALENPTKYSHIKLEEEHEPLIGEWYVQRAIELLDMKREEAEVEYSWFYIANFNGN
jgi:hypothetical protein